MATEDPDLPLVRALQAGQDHVFEALVDRHQAGLYRFVFRHCSDETGAIQLTQDTFVRAYLNIGKFRPKAKFVTFIAVGGYYRDSLSIKEALEPDTMVAYKVNEKDLAPENGFPLRLIIPRMYAYKGVKWIERIVFTEEQEVGYWEQSGYSVDGSIPGINH